MAGRNVASADDLVDVDPAPRRKTTNAFSELMKPQPRPPKDIPSQRTTFHGRDGLGAYIADPSSFPQSRVVYYSQDFVVINDLYPKAFIHMLILPRDKRKNLLRPQEAFDDPVFLALCRQEERKVRALAAAELQRQLGQFSISDRARIEAMDLEEPLESGLDGRDWNREIMSGTHANPSMNHLHIHVLSRDMHSEPMKKYNHYQSFNTNFFLRLDQFPLDANDHRRAFKHFKDEMICWRCGKNFGNRMAALKRHLEEEFEEWKRE